MTRVACRSVRFDDLDPCPTIAFLILTAVDVERDAMLGLMGPLSGNDSILKVGSPEGTAYLGTCGLYPCALVMSDAGSGGSSGSALTVSDALMRWQPHAVLLVGIAFGVNEKDHKIGDVLVSTQVFPYDLRRKSKDGDVSRAPRPEADVTLLDRVKHLAWSWTPENDTKARNAIRGPILSGETLVDSKRFRDELLQAFPTAIGGEMEGAGLYAAAARRRKPWVIIKAICDWGHHKDKTWHPLAAQNATSLVATLLAEPTLEASDFQAIAHPAQSRAERLFVEEARRSRLQQLRTRIRQAEADLRRRLDEQSQSLVGSSPASAEAAKRLALQDAARRAAIEELLNAYNDASSALLHGDVNPPQFKVELGVEIRELCESEDLDVSARLQPREASSFSALWAAFDEISAGS